MADYTTQVVIPVDTGVGADSVVNNWHFFDNGLVGPTVTQKIQSWHTALQTFYNAVSATIFHTGINHSLVRMKTYDLDLPTPRLPLVDEIKPITAPTQAEALPAELAIVLSFNSTFLSGINPARRRGRVFLGPLSTYPRATVNGDGKVPASVRTVIANAAAALRNGPGTDEGWDWATRSSFPAANAQRNVVAGWVDDSFDVQRSRGTKATARTAF